MKEIVEMKWGFYRIQSKFTGEKSWSVMPENHNHHIITVKNMATGKRTRFDFWTGLMRGKIKTDLDLFHALDCFIGDAIFGTMDYHEFCMESGYEEFDEQEPYKKSSEAVRIWKACKQAYKKYCRVFTGNEYYPLDIYEVSDYVRQNIEFQIKKTAS